MEIKVFEGTAVIKTSLDMELIAKAEKACPKMLSAYDLDAEGNEEEIFRINCSNGSKNAISKYGVTFNKEGKVKITIPSDVKAEDVKQYIKDNYGAALVILKDFEMHLEDHVAEAIHRYDELDSEIVIVE